MTNLSKWQKEVLKLEKLADKEISKELWETYNDVLQQVRKDLKNYLAEYGDLEYYEMVQLGKLANLEKEIVDLLNSANPKVEQSITDFKERSIVEGYASTLYQVEGDSQMNLRYTPLDADLIKNSVAYPVAGQRLSERLYKNRDRLAKRTKGFLTSGMIEGKSYAHIALRITRETEANYHQALRIARTEAGRLRSLGKQQAAENLQKQGINLQKRWVSALDKRVRNSHRELDGQTVNIDEKFISPLTGHKANGPRLFGVASEDINCRCTTVNVIEGMAPQSRRDGEGNVFPYQTYKQWEVSNKDQLSQTHIMATIPKEMEGNFDDYKELNLTNQERKVLSTLHDLGLETGEEHGIIIDQEGNQYEFGSNLKNRVYMSHRGIDSKHVSVYHNHTNDTLFSGDDFIWLLDEKVTAIEVVTRNGDVFKAYVGSGIIPTSEEYKRIVSDISNQADETIREDIRFDEWTLDEKNYMSIREQAYRIAREFEWTIEGGKLNE